MQRLLAGAGLLYFSFNCLSATPVCATAVPHAIGAAAAILLIAGLWTPIAGILAALLEVWIAVAAPGNAAIRIALAVLALTLAMIGPGAWSVDSRLYGRKRIALPEP